MSEQIIKQIVLNGANYNIDAKTLEDKSENEFMQINGSTPERSFFDAKNKQIKNIVNPTEDGDAVNKQFAEATFVSKGANIEFDKNHTVKKLPNPSEDGDAVSKKYLEDTSLVMTSINEEKAAAEDLNMGSHMITNVITKIEDKTCAVSVESMENYIAKDGYFYVDSDDGDLKILAHKLGSATNSIFTPDSENSGCYYIASNDEEKTWLNPPLKNGIWYKTIEMYDGKPIYVMRAIIDDSCQAGTKPSFVTSVSGPKAVDNRPILYKSYYFGDMSQIVSIKPFILRTNSSNNYLRNLLPWYIYSSKDSLTLTYLCQAYVQNNNHIYLSYAPKDTDQLDPKKEKPEPISYLKDAKLEVYIKAIK